MLTASAATAADPVIITGVLYDAGVGVPDAQVSLYKQYDSGWSNYDSTNTAADGFWAFDGYTPEDGTYALRYNGREKTPYSTVQFWNGATDIDDLVGQFTITNGVASIPTFSYTLVRNAGAATVRLVDISSGAPLSGTEEDGTDVGYGSVSFGSGYDENGPIDGTSTYGYESGSEFVDGTVTVVGIKPGTYYNGYAYGADKSGTGYSSEFFGTVTVTVGGLTNLGNVGLYPNSTASVSTLIAGNKQAVITGLPKVGTLLSADLPFTSATKEYQWVTPAGPIVGATAQTFVPTTKELAQNVYVIITLRQTGFKPVQLTATTKTKVAIGDPNAASVSITGTAAFGKTLKASVSSPLPTTTQYQWYRNGAPIAGEDGSSYLVTTKDLGDSLVVSITSTVQGHTDAVIPSPAVVVAKDSAKVTAKADKKITTAKKLKVTVKLEKGKSDVGATAKVKVFYTKTKFKTVTVKSGKSKSVTLPKLKKGTTTIKVVYPGTANYKAKTVTFKVKVTKA
jgi:hypothetical protein